jgi:hypothetical protein
VPVAPASVTRRPMIFFMGVAAERQGLTTLPYERGESRWWSLWREDREGPTKPDTG